MPTRIAPRPRKGGEGIGAFDQHVVVSQRGPKDAGADPVLMRSHEPLGEHRLPGRREARVEAFDPSGPGLLPAEEVIGFGPGHSLQLFPEPAELGQIDGLHLDGDPGGRLLAQLVKIASKDEEGPVGPEVSPHLPRHRSRALRSKGRDEARPPADHG